MPKGKKNGKKKSKLVKEEISEFDTMGLEELKVRVAEQLVHLENLKEKRNYAECERDEVFKNFKEEEKEGEELKTTLTSRENEEKQVKFLREHERNCYMQKLKFLKFENKVQVRCLEEKLDQELDQLRDSLVYKENSSRLIQEDLRRKVEILRNENEVAFKVQKNTLQKNLRQIKSTFDDQLFTVQQNYAEKLEDLEKDMYLRKKVHLHELLERLNSYLKELDDQFNKNFSTSKSYYQEITKDNLKLVKTLKADVKNLREKNMHLERYIQEVKDENKKLTNPAKEGEETLKELKSKLKNKAKDELSYQNSLSWLRKIQEENSVITAKLRNTETEYSRTNDTIQKLKQSFKRTVGEFQAEEKRKFDKLSEQLKVKQQNKMS
eukprot:snap_masked-scaffold_7-processed-gene-12.9-mRNA-1 protein AED:1.00 eAED:1.00 QI:0/0/0/0/1/1/2/0/379